MYRGAAEGSGPVATRAPSVCTQPKTVATGATAGSIAAPRVEAIPLDMRMAGVGRGGCRPKTSSVIEGKASSAVVHKKMTKMAAKAQTKFYAVARGRQVGIFTTWAKCCKSVDGFSHNQYKGTESLEQAVEMLDLNGINHSEIQEIQEEIKEEGQYIVETADIEERSDKA